MLRLSHVLSAAAAVAVAGGVTIASLTGSTGSASTAPTSTRTVASVQTARPAPILQCFFQTDKVTGKVLYGPELQPQSGLGPNVVLAPPDECKFRIMVSISGNKQFVKLEVPRLPEGSYGTTDKVYRLIHRVVSLKGATLLRNQPKSGYTLKCGSINGVPVPYRPGMTAHNCVLKAWALYYNSDGDAFEIKLGRHYSTFVVGPEANAHQLLLRAVPWS